MEESEYDARFPERPSALTESLAFNVRRLRLAKGWTQGELAAAIVDMQQQAISLIENGRANPTLLVLESLAAALGVRFEELFEAPPKQSKKKN
jgi:transcriptional regulator with XRE-family HTH domain